MLRAFAVVLSAALVSLPALAEETVRRELVDAGVHVPVLTKAPALLEFVQADYPAEAQAKGLTASVKLAVTLGADGSVVEVTVPAPVGDGFDEAAIAAVKRFRFSPAEVDAVPAAVQLEYVYHFVLQVADAGVAEGDAGVAGPPKARSKLKGLLLARGSRSWIPGAIVRCDNQDREAASGEDGRFELELEPGECRVKVVASSFHLFETTETLEPGEEKEVNYFVRQKVIGFETVVRGQREKKEVVRRTLTRQELQKVPGTFGDPVRVVQNFPGVARAPFVLGQLIVRGANPNQTLIFFDGVEIPLLFHLAGGPSVVNGEFLDRVDFFPGGFGARYGRAVGGVVDVQSRRGASDTVHGVAKVDLLDSSVFLEAPVAPGVSLAGSVRRSYVDALLPLVTPKDPQGGSILVLPVYWDYQVRLDVGGRKGEAAGSSTFSLFAFGSDDLMKVVATGGARTVDVSVDFHTNFHRVVGTWTYRQGNTQFRLTPYVGVDLVKVDLGVSVIQANQYDVGVRQDLEVAATPWLTLRLGADLVNNVLAGEAELPVIDGEQYVGFPGADPKTAKQRITQEFQTFDGALYAEADVKLWKLTFTPGLRASHAVVIDQTRHAFDPRLWVRFEPTDATAVKGSVGLYTQPPNGAQMVPQPFGTPSLTHERAFQTSLGVVQKLTENVNVDLTGFFNRRYENIVSPGPTTVSSDGTVLRERYANQGLGQAYGLELLLRHEVTKSFFGWLAYTFSRAETKRADRADPFRLATFDQTHILTAVASYRFDGGWEVGARFRYVTGRPTTPLVHDYDQYRTDANRFSSARGEPNSARVKDFNQLDLRVDKYFVFDKWTLDVYLDVQNVYWAKNVEAVFTDYRFRQEFEVPGIPILPVIGVKASF